MERHLTAKYHDFDIILKEFNLKIMMPGKHKVKAILTV